MKNKRHSYRSFLLVSAAAASYFCMAGPAGASADDLTLPQGGQVMHGAAELDASLPGELHIHQHSDRAIINWDSFNIGKDALAQFHQPSSSSLAVNRVIGAGQDPTKILGRLKANGQVMVLDRNGVFFGANSVTDVGGIIASTGTIDDRAVMRGDAPLTLNDIRGGAIINQGSISVTESGLAAFVAPTVVNEGVIQAKLGQVVMAAGTKATLDLYGDGLIELAVEEDDVSQAIINDGLISAQGGSVYLQAAAARDIVDNVIINSGVIAATSAGKDSQGRIVLYAEGKDKGAAEIIQAGIVDASGYAQEEHGGSIHLLGGSVALTDGSITDASGSQGGGTILVGGDYLGGGDTPTADFSYVGAKAYLLNDAVLSGDGGKTIVWADDTTRFYGNMYARGGLHGGNGGFAETSGKVNLLAQGHVDLSAPQGNKGTYLLDPDTITIYGNFDPYDVSGLELWLDAADVNGDGLDNNPGNGSVISQWIDKSHNGYIANAVGGNNATMNSDAANDQDVLAFNNDELRITGFNAIDNLTGLTYFYVGRRDTNGLNEVAFTTDKYNLRVQAWTANRSISGAASTSSQYTAYDNQPHTDWTQMSTVYDGTQTGNLNRLNTWFSSEVGIYNVTSGTVQANTLDNNTLYIGQWVTGGFGWNGDIAELIAYGDDISTNDRHLMEQYQSAKWGIDLLPPGAGATEAARAMDENGFGVFTTDYLEKLSGTADIILQATNDITLDLQGDDLVLDGGRNVSLTTSGGHIQTASSGSIVTQKAGTGGNITFTTGGSGNILVNHALSFNAQNGGTITFNSGGSSQGLSNVTVMSGIRAGDLYIPPVQNNVIPPSVSHVVTGYNAPAATTSAATGQSSNSDSLERYEENPEGGESAHLPDSSCMAVYGGSCLLSF